MAAARRGRSAAAPATGCCESAGAWTPPGGAPPEAPAEGAARSAPAATPVAGSGGAPSRLHWPTAHGDWAQHDREHHVPLQRLPKWALRRAPGRAATEPPQVSQTSSCAIDRLVGRHASAPGAEASSAWAAGGGGGGGTGAATRSPASAGALLGPPPPARQEGKSPRQRQHWARPQVGHCLASMPRAQGVPHLAHAMPPERAATSWARQGLNGRRLLLPLAMLGPGWDASPARMPLKPRAACPRIPGYCVGIDCAPAGAAGAHHCTQWR